LKLKGGIVDVALSALIRERENYPIKMTDEAYCAISEKRFWLIVSIALC